MIVAVPKETAPAERRVALVPETVGQLVAAGHQVRVRSGAGTSAGFLDEVYREAGAQIAGSEPELYSGADLVARVVRPSLEEAREIPENAVLVAVLQASGAPALVRELAERRISALAMELVPRITRAQRMDALSSQSTAAGYQAVLVAADELPKFFPLLMTAAGTIPPARVLVLGAGVAGLQAIATARRLGAVVQAFDIRPAVKEQVESLGATFVGLQVAGAETAGGYAKEVTEDVQRQEHELLHGLCADSDAVITTALIPGKPAPVLITDDMVAAMRPGSVIVDLAAEAGGNCELTVAGETVERHGVRIVGLADAPSRVPYHASQMYSRNVGALLNHLVAQGELRVDLDDEITGACCVTHAGEVVNPAVRELVSAAS